MGYSNRFVLCILINGVPQKELANGEVHIPFGTIYALRLRNRHNRSAAVQIYIDGENVGGEGYKIPANDKIDIKRYADKDVTFRFVDLESPEAIEHGKNGPNPDKIKGVVEARFYLAIDQPTKVEHHHYYQTVPRPYPLYPIGIPPYVYNGSLKSYSDGTIGVNSYVNANDSRLGVPDAGTCYRNISKCGNKINFCCDAATVVLPPVPSLREGATVEGHVSGQKFHQVYMDLETDFVSVKLFIKGYDPAQTPTQSVQEPIRENTGAVLYCENCGVYRENKMSKFCGNCGKMQQMEVVTTSARHG